MLSASIALAESAKLLRTPKVYNAIITTDEMLTPSRAFPLIQPVIQPAIPVFSSFYPGLYDPYSQNSVSEGNGRDLNVRSFVETLRLFFKQFFKYVCRNRNQSRENQTSKKLSSSLQTTTMIKLTMLNHKTLKNHQTIKTISQKVESRRYRSTNMVFHHR